MSKFKRQDFFVFGYFGYDTNQLDGQTVKTRSIHELIESKLGQKISFYDTESLKKEKHSFVRSLFEISKSKIVIYLPAHNNLKKFFPFLYALSNLFKFEIHYFVVGGWLPEFTIENTKIASKLRNIKCIYVETESMLNLLKNDKFYNVIWFPNFRKPTTLNISSFDDKISSVGASISESLPDETIQNAKTRNILKLVFMSRITLLKGIDVIFRFLEEIHKNHLESSIAIDFYGQIDPKIEDYFQKGINKYSNAFYNGVLEPENVQTTLSKYDLMLFPTRYPGEGCPGAIIDANMAGLPVLASDWKYNKEFIIVNETGFLFPLDNEELFYQIILDAVNNRKNLELIKHKSKAFSDKFTSDSAWMIIKKNLNIT